MFWYGHGSWVAIVLFLALLALRFVAVSRRRALGRGRPRYRPMARSSFTSTTRRGDPFADQVVRRPDIAGPPGPGGSTVSGTAPGWFVDPYFKHEHRYWSGTEWTEHVTDGGVPGTDPPPARPDPHSHP